MSIQRCEEKSAPARRWERERKTPFPLAPLFVCFFLPMGLPYVNWGRSWVELFVPPEVLTPVLGPSFVLFLQASPFLDF